MEENFNDNENGIVTVEAFYEHVIEWNLLDAIVAICTDTTASNTGTCNGSVVLFQSLTNRKMLYFACRLHEVMISGVFNGLFGEGSSRVPLYSNILNAIGTLSTRQLSRYVPLFAKWSIFRKMHIG